MASRGRARGKGASASRGASSGRGRGSSNTGPSTVFGQNSAAGIAQTNGLSKNRSRSDATSAAQTRGSWPERYEKLERARKAERVAAIKNGEMQDPDTPRALAQAITPVGKCPDMCAEFERVERVVQKDVWAEEMDPTKSAYTTLDREPDEARMVKKFRRSAAGIEEQLPSDLRPPHVLKRTCDYLFNEVIGNAPDLAKVHHFVWDRTRAVRNDFSIQQIRDAEGLRLAVDCYERIARFHILSLHQLALPETPYFRYDWQQEREQLDRTLLSLIQYYDDSRDKIDLPNESEFRAYLIIFQLQDPIPDLEDRVQTWPSHIIQHARIRKSLKLYAAACNTKDVQGPLKPMATHLIARQDWQRFWNLVSSTRTSYLAACVAEIYFNMIRSMALQGLLRSSNQKSLAGDFTADEMLTMLSYDSEEELVEFLACYNIALTAGADGQLYANFSALKGRQFLPSPTPALPRQMKTDLVEEKRFGRSFPAVISGLSVKQAQEAGMVLEEEMVDDNEAMEENTSDAYANGHGLDHDTDEAANDGESLFLPDTSKPKGYVFGLPSSSEDSQQQTSSIFAKPAEQPKASPFGFGQPSNGGFGAPSGGDNPFAPVKVDSTKEKPKFNFLSNGTSTAPIPPESASNGLGLFSKPPIEEKLQSSPFSGFGVPPAGPAAPDAEKSASTAGLGGFKSPLFSSPFNGGNESAVASSSAPLAKKSPFGPFSQEGSDSSSNVSPTTNAPTTVAETPAASPFSFTKPAEAVSKPTAPTYSFAQAGGSGGEAKPWPTFDFMKAADSVKPKPTPTPIPSFAPKHVETSQTTSPHQPAFDFAPPPKPASPPADKPSLSSAPRRTSGVDFSSKPAKPSPLAQSFTFGGNTAGDVTSDAPSQAEKLDKVTTQTRQVPAPKPKQIQELDFTAIITRIARDITLDPVSGLVDQYVDYTVRNLITDVQETLYLERINAEATAFRLNTLSQRYGRRWKNICHHKRLVQRGREKRRRTQQRLAESRNGADTNSLADSIRSRAESHLGSILGGRQSRQEAVDKMFQSSSGNGRWATKAKEDQIRGGSKRPTSSHGASASPGPQINGHKRLKSTSHVDDSGRVAKPTATSVPANTLQRASFLASMTGLAPPPLSTQTNYFRLKAAGRTALGNTSIAPTRKRQHDDMAGSQPAGSPPAPVAGPTSQSGSPASAGHYHQRQASTTSNKSLKVAEEDDALLARLRAARESLRESTAFFHAEAAKPEPELLRQSNGSQHSYESPSLDRARLEARLRASQNGSERGTADVPAYRLRESRFVPREHYGRAIERSKDMREARSREASRRQSASQDDITQARGFMNLTSGQLHNLGSGTMQPPPPSFGSAAGKPSPSWPSQAQVASRSAFGGQTMPAFEKPSGGLDAGDKQPPIAQAQAPVRKPSKFGPPLGVTNGQALDQPTPESTPFLPFDFTSQQTNGQPVLTSQSQWDNLERAQPTAFGTGRSGLSPPPIASQSQGFANAQPDPFSTFPPVNLEDGFGLFSQDQAAPQDHTIQPSQIQETLSASFGHGANDLRDQSPYRMQFAQDQYPGQGSYGPPKATTNLESSDDDFEVTEATGPHINGTNRDRSNADHQPELAEEEYADAEDQMDQMLQSYGTANPFAALANGDEEDDGKDDEDDQSTQWNEEEQNAQVQYPYLPDSYQYTYDDAEGYDDEESGDGDIENEDGEEYDELGEGYEDGEDYDEDETIEQSEEDAVKAEQQKRAAERRAQAIEHQREVQARALTSTYRNVGNNENEAIELSD